MIWWHLGTLDFAEITRRLPRSCPGRRDRHGDHAADLPRVHRQSRRQIPLFVWAARRDGRARRPSRADPAATMVTAGVFLVVRRACCSPGPAHPAGGGVIGALTAFFAATIALRQNELKEVLAYPRLPARLHVHRRGNRGDTPGSSISSHMPSSRASLPRGRSVIPQCTRSAWAHHEFDGRTCATWADCTTMP